MRKNTVPMPRGPQYRVIDVTPELAEKWLAQNTHNRNLRENAVDAYARDMQAGNWAENGEAVKFAEGTVLLLEGPKPLYGGALLDGQHRLWAVAQAGVTVRMLVVTGLSEGTQETMDDGRKRTLADALTLRGEQYAVALAAVLRRSLMWTNGQRRNTGAYTPTNTECLNFLQAHPEARQSAAIARSLHAATKLPASVLGLTHWVCSRIDAEDADWFFEHLGTGAALPQYHPILTLRKKAAEVNDAAGRVPEDVLLAFVIKAWNAYRDGSELRLLRFKPGGATPEKFPLPR
ncbi:hypothetical protein AB0451_03460 [Streptomyces sp. NPDC052000]|uniref:hypothetical protein n=1 Tax=Streptomyces sp. NPDC052000 TaxID=3155676 RepID=UPI00344F9942